MSTVKTYNVDSGDTTNLVLKTNGTTALTINGTTQAVTVAGALSTQPGLLIAAGTASAAPVRLTSGTNLTSATAGAVEYDGKVFYATPQGTQRGVIPGAQFYRLDSGLAGANVNTAQNVLGVGVTLSGSTVYEFEAVYVLSKSAGTTSHTIGLGFGGTATVNNIIYAGHNVAQTSATPSGADGSIGGFVNNSLTNAATTGAITTAAITRTAVMRGTISVNAGGTLIPQYTLSAAPGGAYTTQAGSYFLIYPIGASGANTSVGAWA